MQRRQIAEHAKKAPSNGRMPSPYPKESATEPSHAPAALASWNPAILTVVARFGALLAAPMSFEARGGIMEKPAAPTTNIHGPANQA